ncbi:hypothetical protein GCM10020367_23190 [Streptomyces sannanensis]|uniref:Hyaluronidase n=1 Tax=Streptomyces sannanensis TaxID=285536 RepID=A0ABP6S9P8_9ACTN
MKIGHRRKATAVTAAVIGGLLGTAVPGASAAPKPTAPPPAAGVDAPSVWPRPQSVRAGGSAVRLGPEAALTVGEDADSSTVGVLRTVLREAGVTTLHLVHPGEPLPAGVPVVHAGGAAARNALRALRMREREDLPDGGYRLAAGRVAGRDTVALDGTGEDGLFHAAQTLRQLVTNGSVPAVVVRDWPGTAVRGTTEGFYGRPWSREQRLEQLDFMGRTKQNLYLYAPGDDPYRQARWRDPYPAERRAEFRDLAERARHNHVTLGWAVAPAQAMCLASDKDVAALTRKIDAMWALGVRAFQLQFQDVSYSEWHCDKDADTFGSGPEAAAKAQARVAGAVARHLAERYPGEAAPLSLMPTEYHQDGSTDYRRALARELDGPVQVAWTGVGVVPRTITGRELAGARTVFRHPLVTMDNYPVNDYAQDRIFLGPYTGREPAVAGGSAALLTNAMEQASASRIPLFTAADFAWNPKGYVPEDSWRASLDDLADGDPRAREALTALAGNDASSLLNPVESAYLRPLMKEFWATRGSAPAVRDRAAARLRAAFGVMREAPQRLRDTAGGELGKEARPWIEQLARYGRAGELSVDMLQAQARGDGATAWSAALALEPLHEAADADADTVTVGKGVLDAFLDRAERESADWTGASRRTGAGEAEAGPGTYTVRLDRVRPLAAVTAMTTPGAAGAVVEAHVPGEGWRRLGPVAASGWTQTAGGGVRADALRLTWTGRGPTVRALVPWFVDEPAAALELVRGTADMDIGGAPQRVEVRLTARRPGPVAGALKVTAPKGVTVSVPVRTTVPRGSRTTVPVVVAVPAGTPAGEYPVTFAFGGERRTLTVRAYPRTAGPDLARTGRASSSGDETPDFPAAAAADGDPGTRWSSPAEDGAWWQTELAGPVRLGQVVLHWEQAYPSAYRVQVSADGRAWRTAATVRDGRGGVESVRMDEPGTRFVRVQSDRRATRFGVSLFTVEAYAVAD